jgi:hypothetical protein
MQSSKKFCKDFIMQGRKLRRIKTTIRGARKGSSQESRGDRFQSRTEEFLVLRSWISSLMRDRLLIFCSTRPDSLI